MCVCVCVCVCVYIYALLMLRNSLKIIKIHQNMSEFWQIVYKNIILTLVLWLVLLYELFINVQTWITLDAVLYLQKLQMILNRKLVINVTFIT